MNNYITEIQNDITPINQSLAERQINNWPVNVRLKFLDSVINFPAEDWFKPGALAVFAWIRSADPIKWAQVKVAARERGVFVKDLDAALDAYVSRQESELISHNSLISPPEWPVILPVAYYGLAGDFVRAIEPHTEADPIAILIQFLIQFGIVIDRHAHQKVEADCHYTNLFGVLVGNSAKGRKGTSAQYVTRLFHVVAPQWVDEHSVSGLSSGEGLIWEVRDSIVKQEPIKERGRIIDYQDVTTDFGVDDKRLLVLESELVRVLRVMSRDGNTLSPTIRQAWDTGMLRTMVKNNPAKATDAHIGIIGHITIEEVQRYLKQTEAANGFANRFLWVLVKRSKLLPEGGSIHKVNMEPLVKRLVAAVEFAKTAGELQRDDEAKALWRKVYPELSAGKPGLLGAVCARAEAQVLRLSCIYALLDGTTTIGKPHMEAALAVWAYAEASAAYIFGDTLGDSIADQILQLLRSHPEGMTRSAISDSFGRHRKSDEITSALKRLHAQRLAHPKMTYTGGRPSEVWVALLPEETAQKAKNAQKVGDESDADSLFSLNSHNAHPDSVNQTTLGAIEHSYDDSDTREAAFAQAELDFSAFQEPEPYDEFSDHDSLAQCFHINRKLTEHGFSQCHDCGAIL